MHLKADDLPGRQAWMKMDPVRSRRPAVQDVKGPATRHSAVLILCSLQKPESLLYTLRNNNLPNHGGQISFPGGRRNEGETLLQTASREAEEEVGIRPHQYETAGCLSPLFVAASQFVIHPWLAFTDDRPGVTVQTSEVSEAFWVKLDDLRNTENIRTMTKSLGGKDLQIPYWDIHPVPLWGATAMITSEIVEIYHRYLQYKSGSKVTE